jgi:hypothetical protein
MYAPETNTSSLTLTGNQLRIVHPTFIQLAPIVGVCRLYLAAAAAIADDREARAALLAGELTLGELARNGNGNGNGHRNGESLASHLAQASDEELEEAARAVGVKSIWERMVEPLLR